MHWLLWQTKASKGKKSLVKCIGFSDQLISDLLLHGNAFLLNRDFRGKSHALHRISHSHHSWQAHHTGFQSLSPHDANWINLHNHFCALRTDPLIHARDDWMYFSLRNEFRITVTWEMTDQQCSILLEPCHTHKLNQWSLMSLNSALIDFVMHRRCLWCAC